jgi:hypothetical protein
MSGLEMDEDGKLRPLNADQWKQRCSQLERIVEE